LAVPSTAAAAMATSAITSAPAAWKKTPHKPSGKNIHAHHAC
jgi:hypothetical protein